MTKKQRARQILDLLAEEYPLADCTLQYDEAWKLLVSVRLAAQCTDARVNVVVEGLYHPRRWQKRHRKKSKRS